MARAIDTWWTEAGEPDDWTVVDAGAGPGTLLRSVLAAEPRCGEAMRPIAVDRSAAQRARHPEGLGSRADLPDGPITGVIIANELLDNVPWRVVERTDTGWSEVWVTDGGEQLRPADDEAAARADRLVPAATAGSRIPLQDQAVAWLGDALHRVERGRVVVLDYGAPTADLVQRQEGWMRTYRGHERGSDPLVDPGSQDITVDVAVDQLSTVEPPTAHRSQAEFLRAHGLDELVAEGRQIWAERAHLGDLEALKARSRVNEAEALIDPTGLGAFRVLQWDRVSPARPRGR